MKIINFGSINIDHVYCVEHFVKPGETLRSESYNVFSGGKGANQSISLARAGANVLHAGKVGKDGIWLKEKLEESGVDTALVESVDLPTGHAVIQVNSEGENAIIIHAGANESFSDRDIEKVLSYAKAGDYLLLQNEINSLDKILQMSKDRGLTIVFNPAPMRDEVKSYPLECVDIFIINELEGEVLSAEKDPYKIVSQMQNLYPQSKTVLTLGKKGILYKDRERCIEMKALDVRTIDTTGAGDTFIGYFLSELSKGEDIETCLQMGIKASALCVGRQGAADSIPQREEVQRLSF